MKLKKVFLSAVILIGVLAGCSSNDKNSEVDKTPVKSEEVVIYLTRHGKTMLNTTDRSQGWIDAPLTPAGVEVAEALGRGLKAEKVKFDEVVTSDSGRAIETGELVLLNNGQKDMIDKMQKDKRLREFNFGTFEGMPNEEMQKVVLERQGVSIEAWTAETEKTGFAVAIKDFANTMAEMDKENVEEGVNWPAEDYETIVKRSTAAIDDIVKNAQKNGHKNVLVVSHGMTITTIIASLDKEAATLLPPSGPKNASVTKITYKDGKYKVETVNDLTYIEKGNKK